VFADASCYKYVAVNDSGKVPLIMLDTQLLAFDSLILCLLLLRLNQLDPPIASTDGGRRDDFIDNLITKGRIIAGMDVLKRILDEFKVPAIVIAGAPSLGYCSIVHRINDSLPIPNGSQPLYLYHSNDKFFLLAALPHLSSKFSRLIAQSQNEVSFGFSSVLPLVSSSTNSHFIATSVEIHRDRRNFDHSELITTGSQCIMHTIDDVRALSIFGVAFVNVDKNQIKLGIYVINSKKWQLVDSNCYISKFESSELDERVHQHAISAVLDYQKSAVKQYAHESVADVVHSVIKDCKKPWPDNFDLFTLKSTTSGPPTKNKLQLSLRLLLQQKPCERVKS
jgi:hypothetical protein